ncbi:MAG: nicotinamide mononucleotide transporter [Acidimicrobiia bacterium]|nr:nicotinamide mononucleotide transporter [Acidimicrobiia bacterium]
MGVPVTWIEVVGDVTALITVWWVARQVIWNWPMSLVSAACLTAFFFHIDLDANAWLQGTFFALGVWGWREWSRRDRRPPEENRPVRRTTMREWISLGLGFAAVWAAAGWFFSAVAVSAQPFWDSLTFALSLVATYGQAKKLVESWFLWILIDIISVPLFWSQDGRLTAMLFAILGIVCLFGLRDWARDLRRQAPAAIPSAVSI